MINEKKCYMCKRLLPLDSTHFPKCGTRGFGSYCKPCHVRKGGVNLKKRFEKNPEKYRELWRKQRATAREKNPEKQAFIARKSRQKIRAEMVNAYGGKCSCCGENKLEFLTLEHVYKNGAEHRRKIKTGGGNAIWLDLKRRGWPKDGFTILCWNCHMATAWGHKCPHNV